MPQNKISYREQDLIILSLHTIRVALIIVNMCFPRTVANLLAHNYYSNVLINDPCMHLSFNFTYSCTYP